MDTTVLKCPTCGSNLQFTAETQNFKCEFCGSAFTQEEIFKIIDSLYDEMKDKGNYIIYKIIHILSFIVLLIRYLCDIFYNILILAPVYTMSDHCLSFIREIAIFLLREKSPID